MAKEIGLSLASIPFMGVLTTPIILAEIYGYSKCYDNVRRSSPHAPASKLWPGPAWPHSRGRYVALRSF